MDGMSGFCLPSWCPSGAVKEKNPVRRKCVEHIHVQLFCIACQNVIGKTSRSLTKDRSCEGQPVVHQRIEKLFRFLRLVEILRIDPGHIERICFYIVIIVFDPTDHGAVYNVRKRHCDDQEWNHEIFQFNGLGLHSFLHSKLQCAIYLLFKKR